MHHRRGVAEGAAGVLKCLETRGSGIKAGWAITMVEEGCVPLLRMIAGSRAPLGAPAGLVTVTSVRSPRARTDTHQLLGDQHSSYDNEIYTENAGIHQACEESENAVAVATKATMVPATNSSGSVARSLLVAIHGAVCENHADRLFTVVGSSGNRTLRANVVISLLLLSVLDQSNPSLQVRSHSLGAGVA